jgi:hypothetical protein
MLLAQVVVTFKSNVAPTEGGGGPEGFLGDTTDVAKFENSWGVMLTCLLLESSSNLDSTTQIQILAQHYFLIADAEVHSPKNYDLKRELLRFRACK